MSTPLTHRGRVRVKVPSEQERNRTRLLIKAYDTASIAVTQLGDASQTANDDLRASARALRLAADFIEEALT